MTQFTVNTNRIDPYKNFKFRVKWDGRYIAGVSKISCLKRFTTPIIFRDGIEQSSFYTSPGTWRFEPVVLERGVTHDPDFENWANLSYQTGSHMSLKEFRKDIYIELLNEQGIVVKAFRVYRCWVSEYQVLPDLDANSSSVAIESITLENEGWERDVEVTEPQET
ncbi:MAG: phage tail protein [Dehalococcoidaceae bacterium]|nr:phage tail protein [Dehalococcoidaceae bacterium]